MLETPVMRKVAATRDLAVTALLIADIGILPARLFQWFRYRRFPVFIQLRKSAYAFRKAK
jgi:hypothetical protein